MAKLTTGAFESLSVGAAPAPSMIPGAGRRAQCTCAIASDDSIACWGYNWMAKLIQPALESLSVRRPHLRHRQR